MEGIPRRGFRPAVIIIVAWTAVGLFFFTEDAGRNLYLDIPTPWWQVLISWMVGVYINAALTPILLYLGRRFPIVRARWLARSAVHVLASVVFSVVELALITAALSPLSILPGSYVENYRLLFILSFQGNLISYWAILGIQHGARYYRAYQQREQQALRLEAQLADARLSALKMQLQPHFLFNTLNAIMVLVRQQRGREAEETIGKLSDLLRCVLADGDAQEVPLRRELEYLELYLSIEQLRFQDRLRVEINADPGLLDAAVPHMALQPIVENAVRHGISRCIEPGTIQIRAARSNGTLELVVEDDAPDAAPGDDAPAGMGIGLSNTRARLKELYGDAARLTVARGAVQGTVVTMTLPHRTLTLPAAHLEKHGVDDPPRG